ncbi:uncharacterized protein (DUF885 family) [Povalibacter uvarum]|uniref:Uncharacterized protein (DUF885 family) n=1 Tax=Povalibacter uvarum TaxID=732238 RepID=A0A841HW18_9GAMM|nr:uncharacterized protein (DUF885 family) [Povalibacter uvarum]
MLRVRVSSIASVLLLCIGLTACKPATPPASTTETATSDAATDARLNEISRRWLEGWLALNPVIATQMGKHDYDRELDDLSAAGRQKLVDFSRQILAELETVDVTKLSRENQIDAAILRNQVRGDIWGTETLQSWAWDPQVYGALAGGAIYNVMAREFAPVPQRLESASARMQKIPRLFEQMRANLDLARVPKIHAETVAKQNGGLLSLIDTFITPNADQLQGDQRRALDESVATLRKAVAEQQKWLDTVLVPGAKGDFRIGQKLYDEKLQFSLNASLSRQEIRQRAEAELKRVRDEMYAVAQTVLKDRQGAPALPASPTAEEQQKAIEAALELGYADRPERNKVADFARETLAEATKFTREHNLVTVPDAPVKVILMPEFQRGVAVAYCDSPGPLDKGLDTYYAISPIPDDWSQAQADSFLREYNSRMIHLMSIHEAVPGHYLEGAHSTDAYSTLRSVLRSGVFAEGWAVYTEDVMADAGYLNGDPLFRLIQLKFYLRTIANAILDQGVHVDNWSREQAMQLMTRDTFQQEREAAGKWVRAQLTSAQLPTYFVGAQEHFDMRKAVEQKLGDKFDVKAYHDKVLSYGAPPVRFVREMMLDEPIG